MLFKSWRWGVRGSAMMRIERVALRAMLVALIAQKVVHDEIEQGNVKMSGAV